MDQKGLTITQLYRETGISRTTLTPLVNKPESVRAIRFSTLDSLCKVLNIQPSDFIEYIPDLEEKDLENKIDLIEKSLYEEKINLLKTIRALKNKNDLSTNEKRLLEKANAIYEKL